MAGTSPGMTSRTCESVWLSKRTTLIASHDLEREQGRPEHKKQDTDDNCACRFECHADCCQQAANKDSNKPTKLLYQQKLSVACARNHDQPHSASDAVIPPSPRAGVAWTSGGLTSAHDDRTLAGPRWKSLVADDFSFDSIASRAIGQSCLPSRAETPHDYIECRIAQRRCNSATCNAFSAFVVKCSGPTQALQRLWERIVDSVVFWEPTSGCRLEDLKQ